MIRKNMRWFVIMFGYPVEVRNVQYSGIIRNRWEKHSLVMRAVSP